MKSKYNIKITLILVAAFLIFAANKCTNFYGPSEAEEDSSSSSSSSSSSDGTEDASI